MKNIMKNIIVCIETIILVGIIAIGILAFDVIDLKTTVTKPVMTICGVTIEREVEVNLNREAKNLIDNIADKCNEIADQF